MNSKVILYCFLLYCFKYVASTPFSEESIRRTTYQPDNWQSDENINENSWNQDTDVSRTQNINSMTHSARRHVINNEYKTNSESQNKHELLPMESLPIQEEPTDLQIDPNNYPTRTDNQHYRQHNSQYHSESSAIRGSAANYRSPLNPVKQNPYHLANREHREPIYHNRGNQQNFNDDTLRPVPKYTGNVRRINPVEINSRSQNSAENLDNYGVARATAQATNYNRNRYIQNSPSHSGSSYLPPQNHHGAKKEGYYYNNERNRHLARPQNKPSYNNQGRYLEVDNFGNPKYLEYPPNSRPKHFNNQRHESYINRYQETADNNENSSSSGSEANAKSFQEGSRQSTTTSNQKNISENTKVKKKSRGPKFMIIHKNGTVEYIDHIDDKPKYSIVATGDKTKNNKDVLTQNDNNDYLSSSNNDYNSGNAPATSLDQFTSSDGTTDKTLTKDSSEHVEEPTDSELSKSNDNQYVGSSGNDNNSKRTGEREKHPSAPPSDSYRHKTSTLSLEEKQVQEYLDSLFNNNDDKASQKSASNTQKSTQEYQEDESMQEFIDSLSKKSNSNLQSSNSDNDRDGIQDSKSDSNTHSKTTTISPVKTTTADEVITISPIETSTENVRNQSSDDSISKLTNKDKKASDDGEATKTSDDSKGTKTNDDSSTSSKDSDKKCHHDSADSDCLTNIDAPTDNDDSTTKPIDTDEQNDVKKSNESVTVNDLKLILDIPNDSAGTLKLVLNLPDNTGKEATTDEEKLKISVDTKDYKESNSGTNKKDLQNDDSKEKSSADKDKNTLIDLINSITAWNKTTDKDFINQLPSDNSTVNLWYLIQMQPQCTPIVEKSKVTTIYPNGTIVEELTETTRQNKDDDEPTVVKTTKITHKDHKRH